MRSRCIHWSARTHRNSTSTNSLRQSQPTGSEWWRHAVIYELYPRSFQDSNGDGIGDIKGITSRLDYLHDLGIDAIWITPMYPSPGIDYGYDISDYMAIDPLYGTHGRLRQPRRRSEEARHPHHHGLRHQPHLRPAQVVPRVPLFARQSQARLVRLARWQRPDRDGQRPAAQQLAIVVRPFRVGVGREDAAVLLPLFLCRATRPQLAQS